METRVEPRALWGRIGAITLPFDVILLVAATAVHPTREDPMNHTAVFREYAQSEGWIAIHFTQWVAALALFGGLVAWIIHGLMVSFVGLFDPAPRLVALAAAADMPPALRHQRVQSPHSSSQPPDFRRVLRAMPADATGAPSAATVRSPPV